MPEHKVSRKRQKVIGGEKKSEDEIVRLEKEARNPEGYNGITTLMKIAKESSSESEGAIIALYKLFINYMEEGLLNRKRSNSEARDQIIVWLRARYSEFKRHVLLDIYLNNSSEISVISILMRLVRAESHFLGPNPGKEIFFSRCLFDEIISDILTRQDCSDSCEEFVDTFIKQHSYRDVEFHFCKFIASMNFEKKHRAFAIDRAIQAMFSLHSNDDTYNVEDNDEEQDLWAIDEKVLKEIPNSLNNPIFKETNQQTVFQDAWLRILSSPLEERQYKQVLIKMDTKIIPYMADPKCIMDFLTDCYDVGGVVSILALDSLFKLIQNYNLDYPKFFEKLYALISGPELMHVRYRSRFFRLVDLFLTSTHLPVALIASFIKRLARLAITAPPSAIVFIVPFIYNLLKRHPSAMILIHREDQSSFPKQDPFNLSEQDPLKTKAIDSSLWEIKILQSHYHPNVATLAKIMSEPFQKPSYNLEDFFDHTYSTMLQSEMDKNLRRPPATEYVRFDSLLSSGIDQDESGVDDNNNNSYMKSWTF